MIPPAVLPGIKTRAIQAAQPLSAQLELTYHCNWRCVFCYNPRHHDISRLSGAEWIGVLDELRRLGTLYLILTGGEPLTHPDFFDIVEAARARAFVVRIFTNGALIDAAVARRMKELLVAEVELSLHGATAEVHEAATGKPGSFERMWAGIEALQAAGVPALVKTPMTRLNEHQLDDIIALAEGRNLRLLLDSVMSPRDDGNLAPLGYGASSAGVRKLMTRLREKGELHGEERSHGGVNCGLGTITIAVDPEGNVYPCLQWRKSSIGNVRKMKLGDVWQASPDRREAADTARKTNDRLVELGGPLSRASFCPALAYDLTGDATRPYESAARNAEIADEVLQGSE